MYDRQITKIMTMNIVMVMILNIVIYCRFYGFSHFPLSSLSSGGEFSVSTSVLEDVDHHGTITSQNKFLLEF